MHSTCIHVFISPPCFTYSRLPCFPQTHYRLYTRRRSVTLRQRRRHFTVSPSRILTLSRVHLITLTMKSGQRGLVSGLRLYLTLLLLLFAFMSTTNIVLHTRPIEISIENNNLARHFFRNDLMNQHNPYF